MADDRDKAALLLRVRIFVCFFCCFGLLMSYLNLRDLYLARYQSQPVQGRVVNLTTSQNAKGNVHCVVDFSYQFQGVEGQDSAYASESLRAKLRKDGPVDLAVIPSADQCFFYCPKAVLAPEPYTPLSRAQNAGWVALFLGALGGLAFGLFGWGRVGRAEGT